MSAQSGSTAADEQPTRLNQGVTTLRLGIVPYLNVQPLIWALTSDAPQSPSWPPIQIVPQEPRRLAQGLHQGAFDAAIVPIFEYLRHPIYRIILGASIGCRGPVASVMLFSDTPLEDLHLIRLDPASLTSVNLLRVLIAEKGLKVEFVTPDHRDIMAPLPQRVGQLLIGDPALARWGVHQYQYDLGDMWFELTGLPFVFAAWLTTPGSPEELLSNVLRQSAFIGIEKLPQVAHETAHRFGSTPERALHYFRNHVRFELGEEELSAILLFGQLCVRHGLITKPPELRVVPGH